MSLQITLLRRLGRDAFKGSYRSVFSLPTAVQPPDVDRQSPWRVKTRRGHDAVALTNRGRQRTFT